MFLFCSSQQKTIINAAAVNEEGVLATAGEYHLTSCELVLVFLILFWNVFYILEFMVVPRMYSFVFGWILKDITRGF